MLVQILSPFSSNIIGYVSPSFTVPAASVPPSAESVVTMRAEDTTDLAPSDYIVPANSVHLKDRALRKGRSLESEDRELDALRTVSRGRSEGGAPRL